jgi:RHS repeat-associated protein
MIVNTSGTLDSYNDLYPYGMQMPTRNQTASADARYKFIGNERDVETGYDHNGDRSYDSWCGRSTTLDPFASKDPSWSPYSYAHNNPIIFCDVNGDSVWVTWQTGFWSFLGLGTDHKALYSGGKLYENGQEYTGDDSYATAALNALNEINSGTEGQAELSTLQRSNYNYSIESTSLFHPSNNAIMNSRGGLIRWSASNESGGIDVNGNTDRPAYIGLAHELGHEYDWDNAKHGKGIMENGMSIFDGGNVWWKTMSGLPVPMFEKYGCQHENRIRGEHKVPLRQYYGTRDDPGPSVLGN